MKQYLLFFVLLLLLCSCATSRLLRQAQKAQQKEAARKAALSPEEQLADLVQEHPQLVGKTTRVVTEHDTVYLPGKTVRVEVPVVSTPATDKALVDSLLQSVSGQLRRADSAAFAQRMQTLLNERPKLSRDTTMTQVGNVIVKVWADARGRIQVKATVLGEKVAYEKQVTETGPVQPVKVIKPSFWETLWIAVKAWFWLLLVLLVLLLIWLILSGSSTSYANHE